MKDYKDFGIDIPGGRTTGNVKTTCPQCIGSRHNKRDRSLSVNLNEGVWNCHYCGWAGTINEGDPDNPFHNPNPLSSKKPEYTKPKETGSETMSVKAVGWFAKRGINPATLTAMRITEGEEFMPQLGQKANTIRFNYYKNGELVNTKFRTAGKDFKMVSGAELLPYNIDAIKDAPDCIITEGEMDALTFIECGIRSVVSVPNGASANLSYFDDYIETHFDNKETIYIAVDTDTKGTLLRDELIRRFGAERCRVMTYGDGCKDANEHLVKFGRESLLEQLAKAPEIKLEGIFNVSDFEPSLDALFDNGMQPGAAIGHANFDALCTFETKRLCAVTGIPGSGKSEFIDEIAERLNIRHGWRFAYFSPENAPLAYHASKLTEKLIGKKFGRHTMSYGEYRLAKEHLEENFHFIMPPDNFKLDNILERAKFLVRRRGIRGLIIDPYNRLESEQGGKTETQYINEVLDRLTNFAQIHDVLVFVMAHPTKMGKNKDGKIEIPTLYDISGSAHWFNKIDYGIVVHRNREDNTVEVHVDKVKFRHLGEVGVCLFKYNINNGRYSPYLGEFEFIKWDNTNHITEPARQAEQAAAAAANLPFRERPSDYPADDVPF